MQEGQNATSSDEQTQTDNVSVDSFGAQQAYADDLQTPALLEPTVNWSASEFIAHHKDRSWYALVVMAVVVLSVIAYFVSGGWFSSLMILVGGGVFIAAGHRPPKVLEYSVGDKGLTIAGKLYGFGNFKSFSVIEEGAIDSIMIIPMQRFMPTLSIYFEPKDEQKIVDAIGLYLPQEHRQQDAIDKLMRKIRF